MIRLSVCVWIVVILLSSFGLYSVKFKVQTLRSQIAQIEHQIEIERESANVVAAEWAYLNRPDRLQTLANQYLQAKEITVEQIADVEAIPLPPVMEANTQEPLPNAPQEGLLTAVLPLPEKE